MQHSDQIPNQEKKNPQEIHLKDYQPPTHEVAAIHLTFELEAEKTLVTNRMQLKAIGHVKEVILNAEKLQLKEIRINDRSHSDFEYKQGKVAIKNIPHDGSFSVTVVTEINPAANTALEGLYMSSGMFCTQNEPHGFRCITAFFDRPDVMTTYTTTIIANKEKYPILLSNGNCIKTEDLSDGRHLATWHDPFKKPSYLFALVAGDLGFIEDFFITKSGKKVTLRIFTDKGKEKLCHFAMQSLKKAMKWDEENFDLEYDLEIFNIVAVADFNFGAMENKSLNIFNSRLVLADEQTTTDDLFEDIEAVIAHEYFHNYTGNRITCRDWFQITLKEGLTVYRDERFTQDMTDVDVKRIKDVSMLRSFQFPEDSGPMSHPIQPKSYIEVNNFYTPTVYNKGAEVIRMMATMISEKTFRKGINKYFELYDGMAVTVEEFRHAIQSVTHVDLSQIKTWYDQNRTPELDYDLKQDLNTKTVSLTFRQSCPVIGKDLPKQPFLIPIKIALINEKGQMLALNLRDHHDVQEVDSPTEKVIHLKQAEQSFRFDNIDEKVHASVLRGFSAPVKIVRKFNIAELIFAVAHETDAFNRWDAHQQLLTLLINQAIIEYQKKNSYKVPAEYLAAFKNILDADISSAMKALLLSFPPDSDFINEQEIADHEATYYARRDFMTQVASAFKKELMEQYLSLAAMQSSDSKINMGNRKLKNRCLAFLMLLRDESVYEMCYQQMIQAKNMSDEQPAFMLSVQSSNSDYSRKAAEYFRKKWQGNDLVITSYFSALASVVAEDTIQRVKELLDDSEFNIKNPNKVRALLFSLTRNGVVFNTASGQGYQFIVDMIIVLNRINPSTAAGLTKAFTKIRNLPQNLKQIAKAELNRLLAEKDLSGDVFEIAKNCYEF